MSSTASYTRIANPTDTPFGQTLIKLISNLCFSLFVLFVLTLTLIAVTYQPPDPWLSSSKSLVSKTLTLTLLNSTFAPDDSLLNTGEDLIPLPPSPSSPPTPTLDAPSPSSCNLTSPSSLNCSDPGILAAIRRFNSRVFKKSILFLSYDTPVPGQNPSAECDASWRFRNRKEKSWRRYRDYRRFRFQQGENCSFEIVGAGKFRSGVNAAPKRTPRSPAAARDVEINDTIPIVGSESDFRKGRYLYYTRGGDYCKGMNQYLWSFLCGLGEARFLNRTFVMDLSVCLSGSYNQEGKDVEGKDYYKAENKELWPNLDSDTSPDALVQKLLKVVKPWRNLYVATNEPFYNYFDKLRSHYKVHLLDDYKEMWGDQSEWYNETTALGGGKPVEFDGYMRVAVDTEVLYRAKTRVETFNNLTQDCKDGIKWCA